MPLQEKEVGQSVPYLHFSGRGKGSRVAAVRVLPYHLYALPDAASRTFHGTHGRRRREDPVMASSAAEQANQRMVDRLIAEGSLWSLPVIAAFRATPRHAFLDRVFQYRRTDQRWHEVITRDPGPE